MKKSISAIGKFLMLIAFFSALILIGCKEESTIEPVSLTDEEALKQIASDDSLISSFDNNFNENENADFLSKLETNIYPRKVWRTAFLVTLDLDVSFSGDSAIGLLTKTFESTLYIAAALDSTHILPDTLIQKSFTNTITRNIIFKKINTLPDPLKNWEISSVSMPKGGTANSQVEINKLTAYLPSGRIIEVISPNDYYFSINSPFYNEVPILSQDDSVTLRIELTSAYSDSDFVSLTYGGQKNGLHMALKKFVLISSTWNGEKWERVYEQTYIAHQFPGFYHAIINVIPRQVLFDSTTQVESNSWGMPYKIIL